MRSFLTGLALFAALAGCSAVGRSARQLVQTPRAVPNRIASPARPDARLAVLWIGHATTLVQIDDKFVLTDPVFTDTVGILSKRAVEPGLRPQDLPLVDVVLISHMHLDHLSLGSLDMIQDHVRRLVVPEGGLTYVPNYKFADVELPTFASFDDGGLRVTAVPVRHVGFRYGADSAWMTRSFTGYVIEYHGLTVYYGGDSAFSPQDFVATARRFPHIDLALLPIAPIEPRAFMRATHMSPPQALAAFELLGARLMIPIHFETFINSTDALGDARAALGRAMADRHLGADRVHVLSIGEQAVLLRR